MINRYELASKAHSALQRLRSNKATELLNENSTSLSSEEYVSAAKKDLTKLAFEEYDESVFNTKAAIDSYYFKKLTSNCPNQHITELETILAKLYDTTKTIYEQINVKPRTYCFNIQTALNSSDEVLENQAKGYINSYLNDNYYKLSSDQRSETFFPKVRPIAESLIINNQLNEKEALEFASKTVLIENLITKICFPTVIETYIEETLHDPSYSELFEQGVLQETWDSFKNQVHKFSKIVSMLV